MRRIIRRFILPIMTLVMIGTLAACGGGKGKPDSTKGDNSGGGDSVGEASSPDESLPTGGGSGSGSGENSGQGGGGGPVASSGSGATGGSNQNPGAGSNPGNLETGSDQTEPGGDSPVEEDPENPDDDDDGVLDTSDNCPLVSNPDQMDTDGDEEGDSCDTDPDGDGVSNSSDNCPMDPNPDQADLDGDGFGTVCDIDGDEPSIPPPVSLKEIPTPEPANLGDFLKPGSLARGAAVALGKAFFWDMQVGSDGQACASCHFHAGADNRFVNQINPNLTGGDTTFQVAGPNQAVTPASFPFFQLANPDGRRELNPVVNDQNDVMSSMGVFFTTFDGLQSPGSFAIGGAGLMDDCDFISDPVFNDGSGNNTRRVEPRNTPTAFNAAFNFSNFHDGRARNIFNGMNPFGELDPDAMIWVNDSIIVGNPPVQQRIEIPDASLASQAVGPPLSAFEMSCDGRTFSDLGKKMLQEDLQPLAGQPVAPDDSVFGMPNDLGMSLVDPSNVGLIPTVGSEQTYVALIKAAFQDQYWNGDDPNGGSFTHMEVNFPLFWGLAIQMYEATLRSDDSKFDQVMEGVAEFTPEESDGFSTFFGAGSCAQCHSGSEFTDHSVTNIREDVAAVAPFFLPEEAIEIEMTGLGLNAFFDEGMYNIAVTPTANDIGRGGTAPAINPVTGQPYPLSFSRLALLKRDGLIPANVSDFVPDLPGEVEDDLTAVMGAFKVPGLRNVELTGPYFHNGGMSTLRQQVQFYTRGGNFRDANAADLDGELKDHIGKLVDKPTRQNNLVSFLLTLTDDRVKFQSAPFDHPGLFLPSGDGTMSPSGTITETPLVIPATGRTGGGALDTFLSLPPAQP